MEIDLAALRDNVITVKNAIPQSVGIIGVAKNKGYGLGLAPVTKTLFAAGCEKVAVSTPAEIETLRNEKISQPLITLYPPFPWEIDTLVSHEAEITIDDVCDAEKIALLSKEKGVVTKLHLAIETGMNRYGAPLPEVLQFVERIRQLEHVQIEGICTHFGTATRIFPDAGIYDENYDKFAVKQFEEFMSIVKLLSQKGFSIPTIHVANSAAVIGYPDTVNPRTFTSFMPETRLFIRPGGLLYGLYGEINKNPHLQTQSVLKRVVTHIAAIAQVEAGESVGYGKRWVAPERVTVATIPVGFGDQGYFIQNTAPSPLGKEPTQVLISGQRCTIIGLVASSAFGVHLDGINAKRGDEVVLIGRQGSKIITLEEVAERNNLISLHLQTMLGAQMEKVYES